MSLSIVVPSRNPETLFFREMGEILENRPDWQVVIVDDASDENLRDFLPTASNLTVLRNPQSKGAGASRNIGLGQIRGDYTIFLDDDDFMDWTTVEKLLAQMDAQPSIDMAVSSYRLVQNGRNRLAHAKDLHILNKILLGQSSRVLGLDGNEILLRLTNYPWTKLYRTEFLRRIGLRFSETSVQNDIYAHWQSLLGATRILVTDLVQCTQTVNPKGNRISNTVDHRRLQAFVALRETYELVRRNGLPHVEATFWTFYHDLTRWMLDITSPASRPLLMREHVTFSGMMPPDMRRLEAETGLKCWELWDMNDIADMVPTAETDTTPPQDPAQWEICLTEISRLKRLAVELRADNDRLRGDLRNRNDELDRMDKALRIRDGDLKNLRQECKRREERIGHLDYEVRELRRHMNSRAYRMASGIRKAFRTVIPARGPKPDDVR